MEEFTLWPSRSIWPWQVIVTFAPFGTSQEFCNMINSWRGKAFHIVDAVCACVRARARVCVWSSVRGIHQSSMAYHHKEPVMQNFDISFVVNLIMLNKKSSCQWSETPYDAMWRHCNGYADFRPKSGFILVSHRFYPTALATGKIIPLHNCGASETTLQDIAKQNLEPSHRKICILWGVTNYDILELWHVNS